MCIIMCLALFVGCGGDIAPSDDSATPETTATTVALTAAQKLSERIAALGEVSDKSHAEEVSRILSDYAALNADERTEVSGIDTVRAAVSDAAKFFDAEDMNVRVMSYNVYYKNLTDERIARVVETVRNYSPDILGIQEGMPKLCNALREAFGDEYDMLGIGREGDDKSENCNVMYKTSVFELVDSGTLWLSETPEEMSVLKNASLPRIMTYQLLERKSDSQRILHVNTHFDLGGSKVRCNEVEILTTLINERFEGLYPVVVTGDFNARPDTAEISAMIDAGYTVTHSVGDSTSPTFQGFGKKEAKILDYCFADKMLPIVSYELGDGMIDGEWASDHNPIVSTLQLLPKVK